MIVCNFFFEKIYCKVAVWQVKGSAFRLPGWIVLDRIVPYYRIFCTYANINTVEEIRRN